MQITSPPAHVPSDLMFEFDIYTDPRIDADVQGSYAEALSTAPDIFYTPANGGHWVLRRIDHLTAVLGDAEHFSSREATIPRVDTPPVLIPFNLDPPHHFPFRAALMPWFSAGAIRKLEPRLRHWASMLTDEVADQGACDFIRDVSSRFPVLVFMEFMGMPFERLREFRSVVDEYFKCTTSEDYVAVTGRIHAIMGELIDLRRTAPTDDLVSGLWNVRINDQPISRDDILSICHLLFIAGMDTVTNVLGFTYRRLATDAALQARLASDRDLIPRFVDEAIRCFGTANSVRIVVKDCERFGVVFRKDDMILGALPISGRDGAANANPNVFDIDRPPNPKSNLTFSSGIHLCLGNILARTEMEVLTDEWFKRIPRFSLDGVSPPDFRIGLVHAIGSLPLRWPMPG